MYVWGVGTVVGFLKIPSCSNGIRNMCLEKTRRNLLAHSLDVKRGKDCVAAVENEIQVCRVFVYITPLQQKFCFHLHMFVS